MVIWLHRNSPNTILIKVPLCSNECLLFCKHGKLVAECCVTRNHMAMLQCNYQVINVEATSDSNNTMHVFIVNLLNWYTGGPKSFYWCDSNYFELEIYPPWSHVSCGNVCLCLVLLGNTVITVFIISLLFVLICDCLSKNPTSSHTNWNSFYCPSL